MWTKFKRAVGWCVAAVFSLALLAAFPGMALLQFFGWALPVPDEWAWLALVPPYSFLLICALTALATAR